jgi:hypothetical protein
MINKYFVKVEAGMKKKDVVDGPVYAHNGSDEVVGRISDYNPRNGFMKIELIHSIDYKSLVKAGIPLSNIIFNNIA